MRSIISLVAASLLITSGLGAFVGTVLADPKAQASDFDEFRSGQAPISEAQADFLRSNGVDEELVQVLLTSDQTACFSTEGISCPFLCVPLTGFIVFGLGLGYVEASCGGAYAGCAAIFSPCLDISGPASFLGLGICFSDRYVVEPMFGICVSPTPATGAETDPAQVTVLESLPVDVLAV